MAGKTCFTPIPILEETTGRQTSRAASKRTLSEESATHNIALDEFCWGAAWMDVDNDTDLRLFVTEHNGLEPTA